METEANEGHIAGSCLPQVSDDACPRSTLTVYEIVIQEESAGGAEYRRSRAEDTLKNSRAEDTLTSSRE